MRKIRKELIWIAAAFLLLCAVSVYRQTGMRMFPGDPVRPPVVFFVYLLLLTGWWAAIRKRVTQRNIRVFLLAEHACMLFGLVIPFLISTFVPYFTDPEIVLSSRNIFIMRLTGYTCDIPIIFMPLFGFYAALGLGKTEEFRLNRKLYYLFIPAGIQTLLVLTNEIHHVMYHPVDVQSVFYYDPNIGFYIMFAWAILLLLARIFLIYRRSREMSEYKHLRTAPFAIAVFMLLYNIPFIAASFVMESILIEYHVSLFFLEIMVWESCFFIGMIPVNTHYEDVFDRSAVAMQIAGADGQSRLRSSGAPELSAEVFEKLKQHSPIRSPEGQELYMHGIRGGYAVWRTDVSRTVAVIDELRKSSEKLEHESDLLSQELQIRSDEEAVREQNRIYDRLTNEISEQIILLRKLLEDGGSSAEEAVLFRKICLIGTYIKRRCNLRLTQQSDNSIPGSDLEICFHELIGCLQQLGVEADVIWYTSSLLDPEFAIFTLDVFESLLEYERFELRSVRVTFESDAKFSLRIIPGNDTQPSGGDCGDAGSERLPGNDTQPSGGGAQRTALTELQKINRNNYDIEWEPLKSGYHISVRNYGN